MQHLNVEAAVRGHGGVGLAGGLAVHALVVAPRPRARARPAELPRGWAQQGLVLVAGGACAGVDTNNILEHVWRNLLVPSFLVLFWSV